jgi:UvrB/uvrC motif
MDTEVDLRDVLRNWPYDPDDDVRRATVNGREVLQVRLPLGIEQYELEGRPDGDRPYGKESVLDHQLERLAEAERSGKAADFVLSSDDCSELFNEGTLYYYRYLHLFQVKDWRRTLRDTARNLQLFDLVRRCAEEDEDRLYLEQWRPYLLRMHAVATAMTQLEQNQYEPALHSIQSAIASIENLDDLEEETFEFERERSLAALKDMASQIEETKPVSELEHLERQLRQAIEAQHFERAAALRDRIRALRAAGRG